MRTTDDSLIAEAYAKIYEGLYTPEIQQALMKSTQLIKAKQPVDPVTQSVVSKDPRASSSLIKFGVENGITSNLEKHFGQDVWNSIKSDKNIAGDLHNWLTKNNLQVTSLLVPQEQQAS